MLFDNSVLDSDEGEELSLVGIAAASAVGVDDDEDVVVVISWFENTNICRH